MFPSASVPKFCTYRVLLNSFKKISRKFKKKNKLAVTKDPELHVCHISCLLRLVTQDAYKSDNINIAKVGFPNAPEDKYAVFICRLLALPGKEKNDEAQTVLCG
jgi:hypothetical protein